MEKENNEIVELKDEDLKTITAGLRKSISKTDGSELLEKYQYFRAQKTDSN